MILYQSGALTFSFPGKQASEGLKEGTPPAYLLRTQVEEAVEETIRLTC